MGSYQNGPDSRPSVHTFIWGYGGQNLSGSMVRKQGHVNTICLAGFPSTPLTRTACFRVRVLAPTEVPNCEASKHRHKKCER